MRVNFAEGMELLRTDLNSLQAMKEREFYDRLIYLMMGSKTDAFFGGSCLVTRVGNTSCQVAAGMGFQYDSTQTTPEPVRRPVYVATNTTKTITAAHATLNRIDIVCIKSTLAVTTTESRRYKATVASVATDVSMDVAKDWVADIVVTAGTADASPVAPATPAGYIRIASMLITAAVGLANAGDVTDERNLLPIMPASSLSASGFDVIVGDTKKPECAYGTLKAALDVAVAGQRILVTQDETLNDIPACAAANVEIVFKRGVTFTKGTAVTGLSLGAAGIKVVNGRFVGFTTGILIGAFEYCHIEGSRFNTCTTDIDDGSTNGAYITGVFSE